MSERRPRRHDSFDYRGFHRYFVTCCTADRRRVFLSEAVVAPLAAQILRTCERWEFALLAYVFMPDHLHLLVQGDSEDADFRRLMRNLRQRLSVAHHVAEAATLWQDGYYERVLRREVDTVTVMEYILANPVRAGIVANATDYPFSWAVGTDADANAARAAYSRR